MGAQFFRIRVGDSPPSSGKCHSKDKRKEDEEKAKNPVNVTKSPKRIKAKKEDRKKRGKTSKRRVKKMKDETEGALEPRKAVASISPEQAQKSHECERMMTIAPASAWRKKEGRCPSWFRGPL